MLHETGKEHVPGKTSFYYYKIKLEKKQGTGYFIAG